MAHTRHHRYTVLGATLLGVAVFFVTVWAVFRMVPPVYVEDEDIFVIAAPRSWPIEEVPTLDVPAEEVMPAVVETPAEPAGPEDDITIE